MTLSPVADNLRDLLVLCRGSKIQGKQASQQEADPVEGLIKALKAAFGGDVEVKFGMIDLNDPKPKSMSADHPCCQDAVPCCDQPLPEHKVEAAKPKRPSRPRKAAAKKPARRRR